MANDGTIALNNWLQARNKLTSLVWSESCTGPSHAPTWTCQARIDGVVRGTGTGTQKHVARDMAANEALQSLQADDN